MSAPFRALVAVLFVFLLAPLIAVLPSSLSNDPVLAFPPNGWGIGGFRALLADAAVRVGLATSLVLAATVTVVTLAIGTSAAYALARYDFPDRAALLATFTAPLLLPAIVLGFGLLLVFAQIGLLATLPGLVIGHSLVTLPYVIRVILMTMNGIAPVLEEIAATLGAGAVQILVRVTVPLMTPGIVAAAALSFLVSFDEIVIALFLAPPRLTTLPIEMFRHIEHRPDPEIAALCVALIALTAVLVFVVERSVGLVRALGREQAGAAERYPNHHSQGRQTP